MFKRSLDQIEAEVEAAIDAMLPSPSSDEDVAYAVLKKHPELARELTEALVLREINLIVADEVERLVAAGKARKVGPSEYEAIPQD